MAEENADHEPEHPDAGHRTANPTRISPTAITRQTRAHLPATVLRRSGLELIADDPFG
jgi:hypothetical protein